MPVQSKIAREELPVILKDEESETLVVLSGLPSGTDSVYDSTTPASDTDPSHAGTGITSPTTFDDGRALVWHANKGLRPPNWLPESLQRLKQGLLDRGEVPEGKEYIVDSAINLMIYPDIPSKLSTQLEQQHEATVVRRLSHMLTEMEIESDEIAATRAQSSHSSLPEAPSTTEIVANKDESGQSTFPNAPPTTEVVANKDETCQSTFPTAPSTTEAGANKDESCQSSLPKAPPTALEGVSKVQVSHMYAKRKKATLSNAQEGFPMQYPKKAQEYGDLLTDRKDESSPLTQFARDVVMTITSHVQFIEPKHFLVSAECLCKLPLRELIRLLESPGAARRFASIVYSMLEEQGFSPDESTIYKDKGDNFQIRLKAA